MPNPETVISLVPATAGQSSFGSLDERVPARNPGSFVTAQNHSWFSTLRNLPKALFQSVPQFSWTQSLSLLMFSQFGATQADIPYTGYFRLCFNFVMDNLTETVLGYSGIMKDSPTKQFGTDDLNCYNTFEKILDALATNSSFTSRMSGLGFCNNNASLPGFIQLSHYIYGDCGYSGDAPYCGNLAEIWRNNTSSDTVLKEMGAWIKDFFLQHGQKCFADIDALNQADESNSFSPVMIGILIASAASVAVGIFAFATYHGFIKKNTAGSINETTPLKEQRHSPTGTCLTNAWNSASNFFKKITCQENKEEENLFGNKSARKLDSVL